MAAKLARIIKSDNIDVAGSVKLEYETNYASMADSEAQQARVVSCDGEFALIEVSCSCGQKFYLKCNYADMAQSTE